MSFVISKSAGVPAATNCPDALVVPDGYVTPFHTDPVSKGTWFGGAWVAPTLINGWANYGGGNEAAAYQRVGDRVHLRGLIATGTIAVAAFVLPIGARPYANVNLAAVANSAFAQLVIDASGNVLPIVGSNVWFSINCTFSVSP